MVALGPRFTVLAAICALAALPGSIDSVDARAVTSRRHDSSAAPPAPSPSHTHKAPELDSTAGTTSGSTSGKKHAPVLPLPASASSVVSSVSSKHAAADHEKSGSTQDSSSGSKHGKDDKKSEKKKGGKRRLPRADDTWDPLDPLVQVGDVEIGDGRDSSHSNSHNILSRDPHHHGHGHHDHHDHKRIPSRIMGRHHHHNHHDGDTVIVDRAISLQPMRQRRHHHHHHDHHGHKRAQAKDDDHSILVRSPHHHHEHDTVIVAGKGAHIHARDVVVVNDHHNHGHDVIIEDAHEHDRVHVIHMRDAAAQIHRSTAKFYVVKRDGDSAAMPGVPGTIDIMVIDSNAGKIASLVMSSSGNSTSNGTTSNTTTVSSDSNTNAFVLDASNSTQTQVFLVPNPTSIVPINNTGGPDASVAPGINVTLQVPMFDPSEAAMKPYCATFDPNPSAPAPLTMEECFAESTVTEADPTVHKSQTFAYEPTSGIVRPFWFAEEVTNGTNSSQVDSPISDIVSSSGSNSTASDDSAANSTATATTSSIAPSSTGNAGPQDVTLVFTPQEPTVDAVEDSSTASFEPASDSGSPDSDNSDDSNVASTDMTTSTTSAVDVTTTTASPTDMSSSAISQSTAIVVNDDDVSATSSASQSTATDTTDDSASETSSVPQSTDAGSSDDPISATPTPSAQAADVQPTATTDATITSTDEPPSSTVETASTTVSATAADSDSSSVTDSSAPSATPSTGSPSEWMFQQDPSRL